MKKIILVGIDFSKGSLHALRYAISIANKVSANIMMVHVMKPYKEDSVFPDESKPLRQVVDSRFKEIIDDYSKEMKGGKLMFKVRKGNIEKEIINQAKYHDAFLLVAGTHGVSGFQRFWIGSNAYKLVTHAPCPIITIRYGEDASRSIKKLVLPIDSTKQTRQKTPFVCFLAKAFDAEVLIVGLYSSRSKATQIKTMIKSYCKQVEDYMRNEKIKYVTEFIDADNITDTIIKYSKEKKGDLIAIMSEQETTIANILLGPFAQQMVNHSPIPVLTIRTRYLYDHQLR